MVRLLGDGAEEEAPMSCLHLLDGTSLSRLALRGSLRSPQAWACQGEEAGLRAGPGAAFQPPHLRLLLRISAAVVGASLQSPLGTLSDRMCVVKRGILRRVILKPGS